MKGMLRNPKNVCPLFTSPRVSGKLSGLQASTGGLTSSGLTLPALLAQSNGIITGEWRGKFRGHKGNIESIYNVNKKLSQDKIDAMRATYQRCQKYIGTAAAEVSDENMKHFVWNQFLIMAGYDQKEIVEMNFSNMTEQDIQKKVQERVGSQNGSRAENGSGQISIPVDSVDDYLSRNYLFVASLGNGKVKMRAP